LRLPSTKTIAKRLQELWVDRGVRRGVAQMAGQVAEHSPSLPDIQPVIVFNASTRLTRLSLNAAYGLLTGWALRLQGIPVIHFVCQSAMTPCVLGTDRSRPEAVPPCMACVEESLTLYHRAEIRLFEETHDPELEQELERLDLDGLIDFTKCDIPLGQIVLPSLRWILRRHHLEPDAATLYFYRQYILSAWRVAEQFQSLVEEARPQAVVVFNGMFYPEATARWIARQRGIRVIAHEVALQPTSAFFTEGEATAYPIEIPADFGLSAEQNARLDAYLVQRFHGNFSMAGIRFWPEIRSLGDDFWERAGKFKQIVPVFTNVVFDTSQGHANVIFSDMFAWLDAVREAIRAHPETFFVIRAHPDESRPGKESRESVRDWVLKNRVNEEPNVLFVDAQEYFSSYELIQRSKFVMIYNSTIGLEAAILGLPVLSGGKARFTRQPVVYLPRDSADFRARLEEFLGAGRVEAPAEFRSNARRFLYYQLFRTSLPFGQYLEEDGVWRGFVRLKRFAWTDLLPENSATMRVILEGILMGKPFLLEED